MPIFYLVKRVGVFVLIVWFAATVNFFLPRLGGENPVAQKIMQQAALGGNLHVGMQGMIKEYEEKFGLTKPLLQIDLAARPGTADVTGHVTALRQLPLRSSCSGTFEAEGIDYDRRTGTLRVIVMSPGFCVLTDSKTYKFTRG